MQVEEIRETFEYVLAPTDPPYEVQYILQPIVEALHLQGRDGTSHY